VFVGIATLITYWAHSNLMSAYKKFKAINNSTKETGASVAKKILLKNGINDVQVIEIPGDLSDHYNPLKKVIGLSSHIYNGTSIASISVAAHEVGHAIQHATAYNMIIFRSKLIPLTNICSKFSTFVIMGGLIISSMSYFVVFILEIGICMFSAVLLFQLATLPVEFDASKRALVNLSDGFIKDETEKINCKKMLTAAALTYVASMLATLLQIIKFIIILNQRKRR
jgi:Zn-dependent membrane protease YugP